AVGRVGWIKLTGTRRRYTTPNSVTPDITHDSLCLYFLPHAVCHLCYDGVTYGHRGQARGKVYHSSRWMVGFLTQLATSYTCQKNERNGHAYQRNHEYWSSPCLCRL